MQLQIKLQGLALPFIEKNQWLVFFPKVKTHQFQIIVLKKDGFNIVSRNTFTVPSSTKLEVLLENQPEVPADEIEIEEAEKNINIAELHEDDGPISLSDDASKYAAFLKVSGISKLTTKFAQNDEMEYDIWKVEGETKTRINQEPVKFKPKVASVFEVSTETLIKLSGLGDDGAFNLNLQIKPEDNMDYEIIFSNDCDETLSCRITDFVHYYDILDTAKLSKTYEIVINDSSIQRGENGGCDVVRTRPPFGVFTIPDGLMF